MSSSLQFLGATGTVTGSKYLLEIAGKRLLIDCGLFQGYKALRLRNWAELPVAPSSIDAVILTHAHLDHSGYLPLLVRNGFKGRVHCTHATAELCGILLPDSGHLLEEEARWANLHHSSRHDPALPLYTEEDARFCLPTLHTHPFDKTVTIDGGIQLRFRPAGHILGSAVVEVEAAGQHLVFSGDLGRLHDPVMRPPASLQQADWLLIESTYGNRQHGQDDPRVRLGEIVRSTVARGGVLVIPTFAVGRAQVLMHHLEALRRSGEIPHVPTYLNSPMAIDATEIFVRHQGEHQLNQAECAAMCKMAVAVQSPEESMALNEHAGPMIILSASGMATGGRVLHHLRAFAPDPRNTILFTGFQAGGTRGAAILGGARTIRMFGEEVPIRARVENIPNFSAHADADEILTWLRGFTRPPKQTFVVHGEPDAADTLRRRIATELGWSVSVPEYLDRVRLDLE